MDGIVVQVSTSRGGVPKRAIFEGEITPLGIAGDGHDYPEIHGGPQQALLLVSSEAIEKIATLGFPVFPGALGENITTQGIDHRNWRGGQRWRVGSSIIEFTKRRTPCNTLDVYGPGIQRAIFDAQCNAHDPSSPRWALTGFYARVVQPGLVSPGDPISLLDQAV